MSYKNVINLDLSVAIYEIMRHGMQAKNDGGGVSKRSKGRTNQPFQLLLSTLYSQLTAIQKKKCLLQLCLKGCMDLRFTLIVTLLFVKRVLPPKTAFGFDKGFFFLPMSDFIFHSPNAPQQTYRNAISGLDRGVVYWKLRRQCIAE